MFRVLRKGGFRRLRGISCDYCGHNTRVFSQTCGSCYQRKSLLKRMPLYLLRISLIVPLLLTLALYLTLAK